MAKDWSIPRPAWGVQSPTEFKRGYLIGALMLGGMFDGFYPTPVILLKNQNTMENLDRLAAYAREIADKQKLTPAPVMYEYAEPGMYGLECASLKDLALKVLNLSSKTPTPEFNRSSKFLCGVLTAAIDLYGEINPASISIAAGIPYSDILRGILSELQIPSANNATGVSVRGKYAINTLLGWLQDERINTRFDHFNRPVGQS